MRERRQIKFRAWDKRTNQMFLVREMFWLVGGLQVDDGATTQRGFAPKDFDVMQYTGLKDKNGKEIYEGDIVTLIDNSGQWGEEDCLTTTVKWSESGLNWNVYPCHNLKKYWRVIGNIYENPVDK